MAKVNRAERGGPRPEASRRSPFVRLDAILANRLGYRRPDGGFFLWLDVSEPGNKAATIDLWRGAGLRVVPGSYLARPAAGGSNPGAGYIRLALVDDLNTTQEALTRLAAWAS
jgi:aspartate/methionine/tyrosine aminotransferase